MILTLEEFINEAKAIKSGKMKINVNKQIVYFVDTWFPVKSFIKDFPRYIEYSIEYVNGHVDLKYYPSLKRYDYLHNNRERFKESIKKRTILNIYLSEYGLRRETLNNEIINKIETLPNLIDYKVISDTEITLTFFENGEETTTTRYIDSDGKIDI